MSGDLHFLKVWLSSSLFQDAFIFTTRPGWKITHWRVVLGGCRDLVRLIVLDLKIEHFKRVKSVQVIKVSGRIGFHLLKERCNISLILQGELHDTFVDIVCVEAKLESAVPNVVG